MSERLFVTIVEPVFLRQFDQGTEVLPTLPAPHDIELHHVRERDATMTADPLERNLAIIE
jgi:hypothetical protein